MAKYFIELAYNGENFSGWQKQPNASTIQEELERVLNIVFNEKIETVGCGRTDAGVNASQFFAHFSTEQIISNNQLISENNSIIAHNNGKSIDIVSKINKIIDKNIVIYKIFKVDDDLHARFSAKSRTYKYFILLKKNPFKQQFSYYIPHTLDINKMNEACVKLHDYTNFSAFSKLHTQTFTNNCKILKAQWIRNEDELVFTIQADRFLRNMVRAIVGTMLDVGSEKINIDDFCKIIESNDRSQAGFSVPAHALYLASVTY
ncbi:tRNA pseudouridine synthase A [Bacteroidia bacterium]|nr:tRNA pseudouridine synthase A [Bacteroidia bacterium]